MKTVATKASVASYLAAIDDDTKRRDAKKLRRMMTKVTGCKAVMWGESIVGFGCYHYRYASGREGDFFLTGFAARKQALTIYIMPGFVQFQTLLDRLGKHKTTRSCLTIKRLSDVDTQVLEDLIARSVAWMRSTYDGGE